MILGQPAVTGRGLWSRIKEELKLRHSKLHFNSLKLDMSSAAGQDDGERLAYAAVGNMLKAAGCPAINPGALALVSNLFEGCQCLSTRSIEPRGAHFLVLL